MAAHPDVAWVGIDVGKTHHWACVVDAQGNSLLSLKVVNDEGACQEVCVSPSGEMVDWVVARPPLVIVFHRLSGVSRVAPAHCCAGAP